MKHCLRAFTTGLLGVCLVSSAAHGGILPAHLVDPDDGMLDMSAYLASARGFLPVPILITEPAVGTGLGLAIAYFHAPGNIDPERHPHVGPPTMSVGFGGLTTNGTWFSGLAHLGVWFDDHVRYTGVGAYADINLDWYGLDFGLGDRENNPLRFNTETWVLFQQLRGRVLESNWWAGASFLYTISEIAFEPPPIFPPEFPSLVFGVDQGAAGLLVEYDGRNTTFTPTRGTRGLARVDFYRDGFGGDFSYEAYRAYVHQFVPLGSYSSIGLRLDGQAVDGTAPFYAYPFVRLRGIPAMRYQGKAVLTGEAELLWGFTPRWTLVGFGGVGYTHAAIGERSGTVPTYGGGFRYRLARVLGLQGGLDIARGPEDTAVYITMGSAWR